MAISLEAAGKVRQKTRLNDLDPLAYYTLKGFFLDWASRKANADLQFIPFTGTTIDDAGGQVLADAPCTLYVVFARKGTMDHRTAGTATDSYLSIFDDATDDAGAGTDGRLTLPVMAVSESVVFASCQGIVMGTGVVAKAYTDFDGVVDSSAGDAPNGFVIIGQ